MCVDKFIDFSSLFLYCAFYCIRMCVNFLFDEILYNLHDMKRIPIGNCHVYLFTRNGRKKSLITNKSTTSPIENVFVFACVLYCLFCSIQMDFLFVRHLSFDTTVCFLIRHLAFCHLCLCGTISIVNACEGSERNFKSSTSAE